jgi:NAD(P)-dependent dehydrogenase (short-subunit alcohol dehydrogenase family)
MTLEGRVVVVAGATGELGSVIAHALAEKGSNLALLDRDSDRLEALSIRLNLPNSRFLVRTLNLLDNFETKACAEEIAAKFGKIDILLHVVGGWTGGKTVLEASFDDLTFMLNQHIWTSFNVIQAFVPHLITNRWGRIIMITSPFGTRPTAKGGAYAIGKAGQEALMLTLSQELLGTGVTANMLQAKTIDVKRKKISDPSLENASWTTPEELTSAILFLLSEEAGTINGAKIPVYGSY